VVCERLEHFAHKGLGLCDDLEDAHCALGYKYLLFDANWVAVEQQATRAIEINPSYPFGYYLRSQRASVHGQHDFAIAQLRRALELDPLSSIAKTTVAVTCYFAGRLDEARRELEECIDMYPHLAIAHTSLAWVHEAMGDMEEALRYGCSGVQLDPQNPVSRATHARILAVAGHSAEAREALRELLEEATVPAPSYWIAQVHLALEDVSAAMTCLENAFQEKSSWRISAAVDPKLQDLEESPQFRGLLAQVGLADVRPALRGCG
jgi:tetratricopeptide (TPR) repeat protein